MLASRNVHVLGHGDLIIIRPLLCRYITRDKLSDYFRVIRGTSISTVTTNYTHKNRYLIQQHIVLYIKKMVHFYVSFSFLMVE